MPLTRVACEEMDAKDPLAPHRAKFALPDGVIYLDGNSLGALSQRAATRIAETVIDQWGRGLIRSWNAHGWIDLPTKIGNRIARLMGASPDEVIAADSTSVNLFKLIAGALALRPGRRVILTDAENFPTDLYVMQGLTALLGGSVELRLGNVRDFGDALNRDVAAVVLTHVQYKSGAMTDMASVTRQAHDAGALVIWDLSHSAGAIDIDLNRDAVDMAVGCGYKYLNGGPGAPAFLFIAKRLQADFRSPLTGWMGHARPFDFSGNYEPAPGMLRTLCGTPPILSLAALDAALDAFDDVSMADIRAKSGRLGDLFLALVGERCGDMGLAIACPSASVLRGSQISLSHPNGYAIMQAVIARGVIGDFRAPDVLRFGFAPLYVRYAEVWDAVETLRTVLASEEWRAARFQTVAAVT